MTEVFNCPSCNGKLEYDGGDHATIRCEYCANTIIVPESLRTRKQTGTTDTLYTRQNTLAEIVKLINSGQKINAIKLYRETFDVGLAEAKEAVERLESGLSLASHHVNVSFGGASTTEGVQVYRASNRRSAGCLIWGFILFIVGIILVTTVVPLLFGGAAVWSVFSSDTVATVVSSAPDIGLPVSTLVPQSTATSEVSTLLQSFGTRGIAPGQFNDPRSIAIGPDGTLFVGDYDGGRLQRFDAAGEYLDQWQLEDDVYIGALAANRENILYVLQSSDIYRYDQTSGELLGQLVYQSATTLASFNDIAVAVDGTLAASNFFGELVWFDSSGSVLNVLLVEDIPGASNLGYLTFDGEGNLYVLGTYEDALGDRQDGVFIFNNDGQYVSRFGRSGREAGQFTSPLAIAVDGQGRVYVSDFAGVLVFDNSGEYLATFDIEGAVFDLAVNDQGEILATGNANMVFRYSPPAVP